MQGELLPVSGRLQAFSPAVLLLSSTNADLCSGISIKMLLIWTVSLYLARCQTAPIALDRANTTIPYISFQQQPNLRGTYDILISCIATMTLCIWTALQLNLPVDENYLRRCRSGDESSIMTESGNYAGLQGVSLLQKLWFVCLDPTKTRCVGHTSGIQNAKSSQRARYVCFASVDDLP